jgi:hypothetical protein
VRERKLAVPEECVVGEVGLELATRVASCLV